MRAFGITAFVALLLLPLPSCTGEPSDTGGDDTASPTDSAGGDDTGGPDDTGTPPDTVPVTYSVWTPESGCWAVETADLAYEYWWPYGPDSSVACNDVSWYLTDGDRCLGFSYECTDSAPTSDPAFSATSAQELVCDDIWQQTQGGGVSSCE